MHSTANTPGKSLQKNDFRIPKPPKPPEKPLMPYMRYSRKVWERVKNENPQLKLWEVGKIIGQMWRELSEEEKNVFVEEYESEKLPYSEALRQYHSSPAYQAWIVAKERAEKGAEDAELHGKLHARSRDKHEPPTDLRESYILEDNEEDPDEQYTVKHVAAARFQRNHRLMHEILSDAKLPDPGQLITETRLQTLRMQVKQLKNHKKNLCTEIDNCELRHQAKIRRITDESASFYAEYRKLMAMAPRISEARFSEMIVKVKQDITKEEEKYERQLAEHESRRRLAQLHQHENELIAEAERRRLMQMVPQQPSQMNQQLPPENQRSVLPNAEPNSNSEISVSEQQPSGAFSSRQVMVDSQEHPLQQVRPQQQQAQPPPCYPSNQPARSVEDVPPYSRPPPGPAPAYGHAPMPQSGNYPQQQYPPPPHYPSSAPLQPAPVSVTYSGSIPPPQTTSNPISPPISELTAVVSASSSPKPTTTMKHEDPSSPPVPLIEPTKQLSKPVTSPLPSDQSEKKHDVQRPAIPGISPEQQQPIPKAPPPGHFQQCYYDEQITQRQGSPGIMQSPYANQYPPQSQQQPQPPDYQHHQAAPPQSRMSGYPSSTGYYPPQSAQGFPQANRPYQPHPGMYAGGPPSNYPNQQTPPPSYHQQQNISQQQQMNWQQSQQQPQGYPGGGQYQSMMRYSVPYPQRPGLYPAQQQEPPTPASLPPPYQQAAMHQQQGGNYWPPQQQQPGHMSSHPSEPPHSQYQSSGDISQMPTSGPDGSVSSMGMPHHSQVGPPNHMPQQPHPSTAGGYFQGYNTQPQQGYGQQGTGAPGGGYYNGPQPPPQPMGYGGGGPHMPPSNQWQQPPQHSPYPPMQPQQQHQMSGGPQQQPSYMSPQQASPLPPRPMQMRAPMKEDALSPAAVATGGPGNSSRPPSTTGVQPMVSTPPPQPGVK